MNISAVCLFRMESREKCESIISIFNNRALPGSSQPLVVKFADGGETVAAVWSALTNVCGRNQSQEDRSVQPGPHLEWSGQH